VRAGVADVVALGVGKTDADAADSEDASTAASTEVEVRAPVISMASMSRNSPTAE
jgi:hypothetical protein